VRQLDGGLSLRLKKVRRDLIGLLAQIEVTVDFSNVEDVDEVDRDVLAEGLANARENLAGLLSTAFLGRALEHGVRTAIVGRPNVGKSSLLNALLMRERAIVSEVPGTTRDTVEELMEIGGIPIHLVDTAGIRTDGDQVEQLGLARSVKAMEQADLVVAVIDLSAPWDDADAQLIETLDPARAIVVGNKLDLVDHVSFGTQRWALAMAGGRRVCPVSALTGEGLDALRATIVEVIAGEQGLDLEEPILASERQRTLVSEALERVAGAAEGLRRGDGEELACEDIRGAVAALGRLTGEDLTPDLLDELFSRFCIGK